MNYEENMCTETLSEMYANNCKNTHITAQRNALNIYNLSEDDFPDEVILHTGRISKPPEKYVPCESVEDEEESKSVSTNLTKFRAKKIIRSQEVDADTKRRWCGRTSGRNELPKSSKTRVGFFCYRLP